LAGELGEVMLQFGFLTAQCDVEIQDASVAAEESGVDIAGEFRVRGVEETCPAPTSSWVAEHAWKSMPSKGRFSIHVPARRNGKGEWLFGLSVVQAPDFTDSGSSVRWVNANTAFSATRLGEESREQIAKALLRPSRATVEQLLQTDGQTRFAKKGAAYGEGRCMLEASSKEDGIDAIAVLAAALETRGGKSWPATVQEATEDSKLRAANLAAKICGMMQPKEWRSTEREELEARPVFLSSTVVVLELSKPTARQAVGKRLSSGARLPVGRNAFAEGSQGVLLRLEQAMEEFVSLLNAMAIEAVGQDPDEIEKAWEAARQRLAKERSGTPS
jgi:hypothetical protein